MLNNIIAWGLISFMCDTTYGHVSRSIKSGFYGQSLRVAVNSKSRIVSGFNTSAGGYLSGEGWDCNFYFSGQIVQNTKAEIVVTSIYVKDNEVRTDAAGVIKSDPNQDAVILKLFDEVSGCAGGEDFLSDQPFPRKANSLNDLEPAEIKSRSNAFEYRLVKAKKSYFYDSRGARHHKKSYVVCGDMVLVREKSNDSKRVKAEYFGETKSTKGWLNQDDLLEIGRTLSCPGDR